MNRLVSNWRNGPILRSFQVLSKRDRQKVIAITFIQMLMGILDLLGVVAIGLLGALSVSGLQSLKPGNRVNSALELLNIAEKTFQTQAFILGLSAVVLLVGRTVLSVFFTRRIMFFLSHKGAKISGELVSRLLSKSLPVIQERTIVNKDDSLSSELSRLGDLLKSGLLSEEEFKAAKAKILGS